MTEQCPLDPLMHRPIMNCLNDTEFIVVVTIIKESSAPGQCGIPAKGGYHCECEAGWTMAGCKKHICDSKPCKNGGTCHIAMDVGYLCTCPPGFYNILTLVDIEDQPVRKHIVFAKEGLVQLMEYVMTLMRLHTGTASVSLLLFCKLVNACAYLYFQVGFDGVICDHDIDECFSTPCENAGTCINEVGLFICVCHNGFIGKKCEVDIDECESHPCQNGAVCEDLSGGYSCICDYGYSGELCEVDIDDCASSPCLNGGVCIDGVDFFSCQCLSSKTECYH
ncbi:fibropellin-1-like [Watersipora subatra]|uniref:fibropellin-1-like n=1 Tax=Watersipora subatra TaxID=2589382 RepID=UPI00355C0030